MVISVPYRKKKIFFVVAFCLLSISVNSFFLNKKIKSQTKKLKRRNQYHTKFLKKTSLKNLIRCRSI